MSTQFVRHGWKAYADYDRSSTTRWQWLVPDKTANVLSNTLAIFLALSAKGFFIFARRCVLIIDKKYPHRIATEVFDAVRESHSPEGLFWRLCKLLFGGLATGLIQLPATGLASRNCSFRVPSRQSFRDTWTNFNARLGDLPWGLLLAFSTATLYVAGILIGIFSALVANNSTAVSNHPGCGIFLPNNSTAPNPYWSMWQKYYYGLESESGEYARQCYSGNNNLDNCNYFYEPSIKFTVIDNDTCRFKSEFGPLCVGGPSGAFTLTTGFVRPESIGINTKLKHTFVRQATCSPLITDDRFVRSFIDDQNSLNFRYFYGNNTGSFACSGGFSNCTCEISAEFSHGPNSNPGYSVFTIGTSEIMTTGMRQSWNPIFELDDTAGDKATLIIVSNSGIGYPKKQEDPIFPAETTYDNQWYYNTRWHGGVLGCLDHTYICTPDEQCAPLKIWGRLHYGDSELVRVLSYLYFSTLISSMEHSIGSRKALGLDANSKLAGDVSLVLDAEQWKVEVLQLFQTSLARIQIDARNIARGNPDTPIYGRTNAISTYSPLRGLCNMYKFKSTGWRNISVTGFLSAVGIGLISLFLGRTTDNEELRIEGYCRTLRNVEWSEGWKSFVIGFKNVLSWIEDAAKTCHDKLKKLRKRGSTNRAATRATTPRRPPYVTDPRISDGIESDGIEM